ncbi:MAG: VCBS repeat-containing protein [Saprospiraceae bacterium]|nr:VCBS repeat-containing protein [Saprospiraceae bacterium]
MLLILAAIAVFQCKTKSGEPDSDQTLFSLLPSAKTGIDFRNDLVYDREFNIYRYRNFYNGGGVAIGDVNNDGLPDVFFSSNMGQNKLYLNRGNLKFEDVSEKAGITGKGSWATGVAMADVNADGKLDIYVCNSGNPRSSEKSAQSFSRENELFINEGGDIPHFSDKANEFGLADRGLTTHAAFFDYDRDGDLDCYILNNSFRPIGSFDLRKNLRYTRDSLGGHKLMRNDSGKFTDVSEKAGILGSVIAFGLGVTVGDINHDGWDDIYVSNDFFERDYLYMNNGDGTFSEDLEKQMRHISAASMGADMADINNDAYPDIFVTDMLPESDRRIKTTTSFDSPDRFRYSNASGYYKQFTRNMLHLNNGDNTFSDIACLAGAEATDWSWGALMLDMDNDGWKDIYVANGIAQDLTNQDYLMFASDPVIKQEIIGGGEVDFKRLIDSIPSEKIVNYAFHNQRNLRFENKAVAWGLGQASFSNGSAYGDLDNDGDLDLVVNNTNMEAFVYQNNTRELQKDNHYLKLELTGEGANTAALGARIFLRAGGQTLYQEQLPMRGFQSSMDPRPNFGLGTAATVDTLLVMWPTGKHTLLKSVKADQTLKINASEATAGWPPVSWMQPKSKLLLREATVQMYPVWKHQENTFYDWDRDRFLFFQYSTEGPRLAVADVNGNGLEDIYFCGAAGQSGALYENKGDFGFKAVDQSAFKSDADSEDTDAVFFDADGDGDQDLYVGSGGNEAETLSPLLADRLYINDGKGKFTRKKDALPGKKPFATGCVAAADADGDGDMDLFVGMRLLPGKVGVPMSGYLLINDGKGYFEMTMPESLKNIGMITDAVWNDVDGDKDPDLLVVGEWTTIRLFRNDKGKLTDISKDAGLGGTSGLWKRIEAGDFNNDGRMDFVVGNMGLNSRLEAKSGEPLTLIFNDFDKNGQPEQILCRYNEGKLLPYVLRGDMMSNLPFLKKKYLRYDQYAGKTIEDIFTPEQRKDAITLTAEMLESVVLINMGNGKFEVRALPSEAQFAPLFGLCSSDVNGDGHLDVVAGGNFLGAKPEFGHLDADYGTVLLGDGKGGFTAKRSRESGFKIDGEVRDVQSIKLVNGNAFVVTRNNDEVLFFRIY